MSSMNNFNNVLNGNYCIGCGVCKVANAKKLAIKLDQYGMYRSELGEGYKPDDLEYFNELCPFSGVSTNEDQISKVLFDHSGLDHNKYIGYHGKCYAGYIKDEDQRIKSSSGGLVSWLLVKLLEERLIDGVIHVGDGVTEQGAIMSYKLSFSKGEILSNTKSRYYPVEMSKVLKDIKYKHPGKKFAVVGVPCFVKAVRLLQNQDTYYKQHITYVVGIVCGHFKSAGFAKLFAMQCGIDPDRIKHVDFRYYDKRSTLANEYFVKVEGKDYEGKDKTVVRQNKSFFGYLWGHGYFKYQACEFCDDVFAETADITFGDAWLPEYVNDNKGTNIIVTRNYQLSELINTFSNELCLDELSPESIIQSQMSGIRHRRDGLKYRLYLKKRKRQWYPQKREKPQKKHLDKKQRLIFNARTRLSELSHVHFYEAVKARDFSHFEQKMKPFLMLYDEAYKYINPRARMLKMAKKIKRKVYNKVKALRNKVVKNCDKLTAALYRKYIAFRCIINNKKKGTKILLIPPAILNGGFGDDIMTISFVSHFKEAPITLYLAQLNDREDLFSNFLKVDFLSWKSYPKYHEYSGIYLLGADNMTGTYGVDSPLFKCQVLSKGNRLGINTSILGFSLNQNFYPAIQKAFIDLLPKTKFYLREEDSYARALQFLPGKNLSLVADVAFLCPFSKNSNSNYLNWINDQKRSGKTIIAVCPNAIQAANCGKSAYIAGLLSLLTYARTCRDAAIILLYHDLRSQCEGLSDRDLAEQLYQPFEGDNSVFFTDDIRNGVELKSYLEFVDFTLTGRMHLGISGYSLKKPMLGITYESKFSGLQKLFGLDPDKTLINDYKHLAKYVNIVDYFITHLNELKELTEKNHAKVMELAKLNFANRTADE